MRRKLHRLVSRTIRPFRDREAKFRPLGFLYLFCSLHSCFAQDMGELGRDAKEGLSNLADKANETVQDFKDRQ